MSREMAALWCGLAAVGAALILCASAAGAPVTAAIPILAAALAEIAWGLWTMRAGRIVAQRTAFTVGALVVVGSTVMFFVGIIGIVPFVALLVLHWTTAILCVLSGRRRMQRRRTKPGMFVLVITVQAMMIAAITTPALANTTPGESAVPHGTLHGEHHH